MRRHHNPVSLLWQLVFWLTAFTALGFNSALAAPDRRRSNPGPSLADFVVPDGKGGVKIDMLFSDGKYHKPKTTHPHNPSVDVAKLLLRTMENTNIDSTVTTVDKAVAACRQQNNCNPETVRLLEQDTQFAFGLIVFQNRNPKYPLSITQLVTLPPDTVKFLHYDSGWQLMVRDHGDKFDLMTFAQLPLDKLKVISSSRGQDAFFKLLELGKNPNNDISFETLTALSAEALEKILDHASTDHRSVTGYDFIADPRVGLARLAKLSDENFREAFVYPDRVLRYLDHPKFSFTFDSFFAKPNARLLLSFYDAAIHLMTLPSNPMSREELGSMSEEQLRGLLINTMRSQSKGPQTFKPKAPVATSNTADAMPEPKMPQARAEL